MDEVDDLEVTTFLSIVMPATVAEMISAAEFHCCSFNACGPYSLVDIATGYGLDGPGIESRPWGPPRLLYNGHQVFPGGIERPGPDADPSPPTSAVVMNE
jgi:hypothetical protein